MNWKEQVEEFLANLLSAGFKRDQMAEKGYEFALALQTDHLIKGHASISAAMMAGAAELVRQALPGAYRIYERRNQIR